MRSIKVSDTVWEAIAAQGKFGETEDDVLRRVFKIKPATHTHRISSGAPPGRGNLRYATKVMRARVQGSRLTVTFEDGSQQAWILRDKSDKEGIRRVREAAVRFATERGATRGQIYAVYKALTDAAYHLTT